MTEDRHSAVQNIVMKMERNITEIKILGLTKERLKTLGEHYHELRASFGRDGGAGALEKGEEETRLTDEEEERETQISACNSFEFRCTTCLVIKHIDLREKKGKQKSSVCKQCANNKLKERREKARKDGTSTHECVCGSTFQKWGLAQHEQSIKHKTFMKRFEEEASSLSIDESLDDRGVNDPLIDL